MAKGYTNIFLSNELIKAIDSVIAKGISGYKNRTDLCKESVRNLLRELAEYKNLKKGKVKKKP